jgi:hypothetical protein
LEADRGQVCMEAVEMTEAYIEIEGAWRDLQQHKKTTRPEIPVDPIVGGCPSCGRRPPLSLSLPWDAEGRTGAAVEHPKGRVVCRCSWRR